MDMFVFYQHIGLLNNNKFTFIGYFPHRCDWMPEKSNLEFRDAVHHGGQGRQLEQQGPHIFQEFSHRSLSLFLALFWDRVFVCIHAGLELSVYQRMTLRSYAPLYLWLSARIVSRHHHSVYVVLGIKLKALYVQAMHSTNWAVPLVWHSHFFLSW